MRRRDFFGVLAGASAAGGVPRSGGSYGLLTVDGHRAHERATGETLHVWVDGRDVTRNCFEADDTAGYALVWCRDAEQHRDLDAHGARHVGGDGNACRMRLTGHVVIAPGAPMK